MRAVSGYRVGRLMLLAAAIACVAPLADLAQAETVRIRIDQARIVKLPPEVATIVIGNPLIADATLQKGGVLVVTGKGYGTTNLLALDRAGNVLMDSAVQVESERGRDLVVVYRGTERESYSCAPQCERRIMLGDSPVYFNAALAESGARNSAASPAH